MRLGEEWGGELHRRSPPLHPGPCRPLSGPATGRVMRLRELRLGKAKVETGASSRCQVPSCHMWAISHVGVGGVGGRDLFLRPPTEALTSKWSCQTLGLSEPIVTERLAATGNEGGGSWEAVGGWEQGGRIQPEAVAFNLGCTLKSPGSFY